ncbi:MAG: hypothetical protein ACREQ5_41000 [Candidatus Dormibacteria bacterium]
MRARTSTERSRARFERAADIIGAVTLDAARAAKFALILASTGETRAGWVRRMIDEASVRDAPSSQP